MEEPSAMTNAPIPIAINKIHPNAWNPNSMKPEIFEALVEDIRRSGFLGAILVRLCKCPNMKERHYEIVDGEHRWLACQDRGVDLKEIPCYVVERDDVSARIETVTRNREHGELVREKLVKLIGELTSTFKLRMEDVRDKMMIPEQEFKLIVNPIEIKAPDTSRVKLHGRRQTFQVSALLASREQYEFINKILDKVMEGEECTKGEALYTVFKVYDGQR